MVQYKDGGRYEGDFKAGKRDGKGTLVLPGGETYTGQFKDDRPDGTGVLSRQDGTKFSGQFRKGAPVEQDELAGIRNGGEIPGLARNDFKFRLWDDFSESHKKELILAGLREKPVEKKHIPPRPFITTHSSI